MSEDNINLYNLSSEDLREQARILGISLKGNPNDDTIRKKIMEETGDAPKEPEPVKGKDRADWVTIVIAEDETDQQPAFVGINGKAYWIRRGEPVAVPPSVVEVLKHAKQVKTNPKTGERKFVPTYPFSVEG